MKYIYNLNVNFKDHFYDFYEWNKNDKIITIPKIPILKISNKQFNDLKNNQIKIQNKINNNITLFYCKNNLLAIKFNKQGINKLKSDVYIEEESNIISNSKNIRKIKLKYKLLKKEKLSFNTRLENENRNELLKKINKIYNNNEYNIINYIYIECFKKNENNIKKKYKKIKKEIIKGNDNFYKIFNIFKLISQNN